MREVIIVGGGPTGCLTASELAKSFDVLVLEEHSEFGSPLQCMGLVSNRVLGFVPSRKRGDLIEAAITRGKVTSPSGREFSVDFKEVKAYVIDRMKFDRILAEEAMDRGVQFELGSRVKAVRSSDKLEVGSKNGLRKADLLIGADGPHSLVRRTFFPASDIEFIRCYGAEIDSTIESEGECAHVFLGGDVAPSFFAWTLPIKGGARIGLGASGKKPYPYFKRLMKRLNGRITRPIAGEIPIGLLPYFSMGNIGLVGDACCQVKPISGGGLFTGLLGAKLCSQSVLEGDLESYRSRWMEAVGKEISGSLRLRGVYKKIRDKEIEELFSLLGRESVKENLEDLISELDLDYQFISAGKIARSTGFGGMASILRMGLRVLLRDENE